MSRPHRSPILVDYWRESTLQVIRLTAFEQLLAQLQTLPVEKLEDLTEAILDWTEISEFTEWLRQQLAEIKRV